MAPFDGWDPDTYNRFAAEREQPFWDLAHLLEPADAPVSVDLGCGDGRLTAALADAIGTRSMLGIDRSPAMIAGAAGRRSEGPRFEVGDIGVWEEADSFDVVFANASMQWVPDHPDVLARWTTSLRRGGQLAVQVPANADHPSHLVAAELASELMDDPPPDAVAQNVLAPDRYAELLDALGFERLHVRLQVYLHHLASTDDVVEWVKGTTLTRFKEPLGADGWDRFVDLYRDRLRAVLGDRSPYPYPFKRILMWGRLA
ncbi:MAG: methyltransferase domain-containing protein [Acidimicrobiales bacterium]